MKTLRIQLGLAIMIIAGFGGCALVAKRAHDQGQELDRKSRASRCHLADLPLVLLGGGMDGPHELSRRSLDRVQGAIAFLADERKGRPSALITSGGPVYAKDGSSEAALMKALIENARPANLQSVTLEDRSHTTVENARYTAELFAARRLPKDIVLLTGIYHLARAARDFQEAGFRVCAVSIAEPGP
jgi:uncharacterized SAM-binding protein YcdF (DUF218 family)